jgi:hypothetical protein
MLKNATAMAVLAISAMLAPTSEAQSLPGDWQAHITGCLPDPTLAFPNTGLERVRTPGNVSRMTTTFPTSAGNMTVTVAGWRVDCGNDPTRPMLMLRFESITNQFGQRTNIVLNNADVEIHQGARQSFADLLGGCTTAAHGCFAATRSVADVNLISGAATILIYAARDTSVAFRNGFSVKLRGSSQALAIPAVTGVAPGVTLSGRLNGAYYDPNRSGEGFMVDFFDVSPTRQHVFVSWYTYDDNGNQVFVVGNTDVTPGATSVSIPLISTRGGRFGNAFRSADIVRTPWGSMTIRFPNCSTAVVDFTRTLGSVSGSFTLERFGQATGVACN